MGKKKIAAKLARRKAAGKLAAKGGARAVPGAGQVLMVAEGAPVAVEGLRRTGETWWAGTKRSIGHARRGGEAIGRGEYTEAAGHFGRGGLESGKTALASQWELTKGAGRTAVAALLAREAAEATYYEGKPKKKRKKRKKAKKNAGFSYRPQDLFPVQVEDRIYPARWHDASEGRAVLTGWKAVTPEVHQVAFLLDGTPTTGWFHRHGELWWDDGGPRPSWVPPVVYGGLEPASPEVQRAAREVWAKKNPLSRREQEIQRRELAERERQRWREEIYAIRGELEDLRVLARAAEPEALARIERLQRRRAYLQRKLSQSMEEQRREAPLPDPRFEGGDLEDWARARKEQRQYLGRRGRKRKGMLVKKNPWAPSGQVWEHRRWHLPRGAATSAAPEVFYWDDLDDAFRSDDPQEEEWAAELKFHRTPRGGWRWSHDDGMGGTYRHEAHLVPRRRRARFNPRRADVGILPHKEHLMTELVEGDRAHVAEAGNEQGVGLLGTLKNLGGGFWEVVPYFDEEKPLTFHVNQVLYRDRIRMFDSKHPKHLIWRWQLGELASDNSRARRNPKGRSADSRLNPARRNGFTRGFPVAQKAFTVMWEHQRGKRGDLMGLPGSGDYTYYRHFDPRKDRYESMSWPAARAGKFIAELNRMGIKDDRILVLGARGEEIDPAGLKETYRKMTAAGYRFNPRKARKNPRQSDVGMYQDVLAHLRALQWIYWTTHWRTSGPTFYGDHLMLQRLYAGENGGPNINEEIDQLGERMVVYFGRDSVQPDVIGAKVQAILTGSGKSRGASMAWVLLTVEMYLQDAIRKAWKANQDSGRHMSLGLDDYLMGLANERETAIYLLRQVQEERLAPLAER